jgi:indole-3-glycerol phosphate synthase
VEVHDGQELERALELGARVVGVNCRDLRTMEVSLDTALALAPHIPEDVVAVAESGIRTGADIGRLRDAGYDAFLVGERLMESPDPRAALEELLADAAGQRG